MVADIIIIADAVRLGKQLNNLIRGLAINNTSVVPMTPILRICLLIPAVVKFQ